MFYPLLPGLGMQFRSTFFYSRCMNKLPVQSLPFLHFKYFWSAEVLLIKASFDPFSGISLLGGFSGIWSIEYSLSFSFSSLLTWSLSTSLSDSMLKKRAKHYFLLQLQSHLFLPSTTPFTLYSSPLHHWLVPSAVILASNGLLKTEPVVILLHFTQPCYFIHFFFPS